MVALGIDLLYLVALTVTSPVWLYRMVRHGRYRDDVGQQFGKVPRRHGLQPVIWIHAVSLGEVNGIRTLVEELASQLPDYQIVISSTTATGMARARELFSPTRQVFHFPLDFSLAVRRAFKRLRPDIVVLMEGEVWPNFLSCARSLKVPVVLVNGRMSENKGYPGYKRIGKLAGKLLFNRLAVLAVQDEAYARKFVELGTDEARIRITGMMKYDTAVVSDRVEGSEALAAALALNEADRLIVAGGTGPGEEAMLLDLFARRRADGSFDAHTRLAIVPRKPERFDEVAGLITRAGFNMIRRSQRPDGSTGAAAPDAVILGDTMGELRKFYRLATVAFVGRSLVPMGGSDMIEAAGLGLSVAFGPHVFNFPQAQKLVDGKLVAQVADIEELGRVLAGWLADPVAAAELGRRAREFILAQQGATRRNVEVICEVLGRVPAVRPGDIATRKIDPT